MICLGVWVSFLNPAYNTLSADIDFENQLIGTTLKSGTFVNTSIGQTQLPNERFMSSKWFYVDGTSQAGLNQSSPLQIGEQEISILQGGISQIGFLQSGITKVGSLTVASTQVSTPQVGFGEINLQQQTPVHASSEQIGLTQVRIFDSNSAQISTPQVNSSEVSILDYSTPTSDFYSSKIAFSSSIQLEQFLSVHNVSPAYLHAINNTLSTFWDAFLQSSTPFNLNLVIKDLPTGQLAEAQVTQFNAQVTPNSGTLYLDVDANGLGWYIDPTPWDKIEFALNPNQHRLPRHPWLRRLQPLRPPHHPPPRNQPPPRLHRRLQQLTV